MCRIQEVLEQKPELRVTLNDEAALEKQCIRVALTDGDCQQCFGRSADSGIRVATGMPQDETAGIERYRPAPAEIAHFQRNGTAFQEIELALFDIPTKRGIQHVLERRSLNGERASPERRLQHVPCTFDNVELHRGLRGIFHTTYRTATTRNCDSAIGTESGPGILQPSSKNGSKIMELVCPAGSLPALHAAVDNGADSIYLGFRDATNARHFAGLNFSRARIERGIDYAHRRGRRVFVAINTYARPEGWRQWTDAVDNAVGLGADALILADTGLLDYAASRWPEQALHLSVQASATNPAALTFYHRRFRIRRAVLPRVLSLQQVTAVVRDSPVPVEVFGFGSLCVMVEGRCLLSSYLTGRSPNTYGACSPASHVRWVQTDQGLEVRLNGVLIDRYGPDEKAGYPTLCKGRFRAGAHTGYVIEEPTSLVTLDILPDLLRAGVAAVKVEGRQRSPAYVGKVTAILRSAIDACMADPSSFRVTDAWRQGLATVSEGSQTTLGAYHRPWL